MAATARKYGQGAVYGSLAYDFDNPELYTEEYSSPIPAAPKPRTQTKTQVRTRARVTVKTKQGIAPLAIIGFFVAAFLFVTAITAQIMLFNVSSENVALSSQITQLEEEQTKLRIAYESAFNLAEIEDYAIGTLGMQKPSANQIYYIDTSAPDKAVVVATDGNDSMADRVADFFSSIRAYFG